MRSNSNGMESHNPAVQRSRRALAIALLAAIVVVVVGAANMFWHPTNIGTTSQHVVVLGAAVVAGPLRDDPVYRQTLAGAFHAVTPENALKFDAVEPVRDRFTFREADDIVGFAQAGGMPVHGHTLVWARALPDWLGQGQFSRDELKAILHNYIGTVVGRYRGRIASWDVVNEALNTDGTYRDSIWLRGIGPEYIELAFRWAHEADPTAKLFYNDAGGEGLGRKSDAIYALVQGLLRRGVPIGGVGLEMHVNVAQYPAPSEVAANMARLGALGLETNISEMDVSLHRHDISAPGVLDQQATIYREMAAACSAAPSCKRFTVWGVSDRYSWLRRAGYSDTPLLFDATCRPKPAYTAVAAALSVATV